MINVSRYVAGRILRTREDFRVDTFRAGGKGGQNQNKVESGVRITDLRTGLSVDCREERDQKANKRRAFTRLAMKLIRLYQEEEAAQREALRTEAPEVRVYKETLQFVKDHRCPERKFPYGPTLEGHIEDLMHAVRAGIARKKMEDAAR